MIEIGFSVYVQARAPLDYASEVPSEADADALMDLLADYDGVVATGPGYWEATVSSHLHDAVTAAAITTQIVTEYAAKAGLPQWPVARVESIREDVLDAENECPTLPDLVSAPEAADILGVSPQRLHELVTANPGFPRPAYELRAGKLWLRVAIEAFNQQWERKPGRPRKPAASS